ncbi:MAG: tetratricopeptide repeat protein, partial [bacterium]|nr:tetratricopeptide repeat protein [bacterium]
YSGFGNRGGGFGGLRGQNTGGFGQAGISGAGGAIPERELMGCELRANLPGYRSSSVELTGRRAFDNPDVGTILLSKIAGVSGHTISMTTLKAPKKARKAYEKGVKEAQKKKWEKAEKELSKATTEYPEYAAAWQTLGQVYEAQKKPAEAREAYAKALAADEKFINPYIRLALMDAKEQKWQEVADTTGRVLKLNPFDFPDAYFYNSVANLNLNQLTAAEKSAREAIKLKAYQKFPQVENVLGLALAQQGSYAEASEHLKKYLELFPDAHNAEVTRKQIAQLDAEVAKQKPQAQAQTPQQ